jgi:hypothetical protein
MQFRPEFPTQPLRHSHNLLRGWETSRARTGGTGILPVFAQPSLAVSVYNMVPAICGP